MTRDALTYEMVGRFLQLARTADEFSDLYIRERMQELYEYYEEREKEILVAA